jgi:Zn-dependent protease
MRDPLSWSIPLGRLFGVTIRVHLLFPLFVLGMIGRAAYEKDAPAGLWVQACIVMGLLFLAVVLHELGHVFAARAVDGDAGEVMLWPAGGLMAAEVPSTPRAYLVAAAGGPLINLTVAVGVCLALVCWGYLPSFRPWADPYRPVLYGSDWKTSYGSVTGKDLYNFKGYKVNDKDWVSWTDVNPGPAGTPQYKDKPCTLADVPPEDVRLLQESGKDPEYVLVQRDEKGAELRLDPNHATRFHAEPVKNAQWLILASQLFAVNWILFLLNLVPAFPLDGGRLLQSALWWRSDYRQGTLAAIFAGFVVMFLCVLLSIIVYDPLVLLLAIIIYLFCRRQWIVLETGGEESLFGYDFSQGYTSLEREATAPPPPRRRQSWLQRWLRQRAEKRMRREQEEREAEERRMDELLEKVQRVGLQGLTEEERRFLTRVSARYRNRQE